MYKMLVAYDGTAYRGWQVQPGSETIQGRLGEALSDMAKTTVDITGAGRTDAGVHALGQAAHFRLERAIPTEGILRGINSMLPRDIRILAVEEAPSEFHARYSARSKTYRYYLERDPVPLPFRSRFVVHHPHELSLEALDSAARLFVGEHDFAAFRASSCGAKTTTRQIFESRWFTEGTELVYEVSGTGFLHHMIRNMVGTLLEIGNGKRDVASITELFESGDRNQAGPTAAAKGLHLIRVDYS
jgi:tRNA pseudouridine38-40 synthase